MSNVIEFLVPDIGDFSDVPIVEIPVAIGDTVEEGDTLIVLESDKATIDVPAQVGGKIVELNAAINDLVSEGSLIMSIQQEDGTSPDTTPVESQIPASDSVQPLASCAPQESQREPDAVDTMVLPDLTEGTSTAPALSRSTETTINSSSVLIYASPSVRRFARQLGVPIDSVKGTGSKNRMTRKDIETYVKTTLASASRANQTGGQNLSDFPEWPKVDYAKYGPIERVSMSRIGKISGPALARNAAFIPHVTNFDKADITDLEDFRLAMNEEANPDEAKLTLLTFTVKAVVSALKKYPNFNCSLDGDELVHKHYWNIGVAANTSDGLLVPVIKDADKKGLREIAGDIASLAKSARDGKIKPSDMQGATFTISSLGGIGGTNFTPIINAPEVAILGMTRAEQQPVWTGSEFKPRLIQPLSLSWDHRVVDGVAAAHFLAHVGRVLTEFRRSVL